jgi:hypothetical protein
MAHAPYKGLPGLCKMVAVCLFVALAMPAMAQVGQGRTTTSKTSQAIAHKRHHHHRHAKPAVAPVTPPPTPAPPPAPLPPAEQPAKSATVSYQQGILKVEADNSSLVQTMNQIALQTGLTIEGLNQDRRIYGQYGPGTVNAVVSRLLEGAGYNYVLVGGSGKSAAKLILTPGGAVPSSSPAPVTTAAAPPPSTAPQNNSMADPTEPPHPKTAQEIFEELRRAHPQQR